MTLRDMGRFAAFVLDDGIVDGLRMVPEGFIEAALTPSYVFNEEDKWFGAIRSGKLSGYGFSWWCGEDGSASALGFAGQRIWVDRKEGLAIVTLGCFPSAVHVKEIGVDRDAELRCFTDAVRDALR